MKTLVLHPKDKTTDFLSIIYAWKNWTVVTEEMSRRAIKDLIKQHDRIVMLGHGDSYGMYGHGRYVINNSMVYTLRTKECVAKNEFDSLVKIVRQKHVKTDVHWTRNWKPTKLIWEWQQKY